MAESVRNLHLVLFVGVVCVVQTLAQVCPYSDTKCDCRDGIITCYNLHQIPSVNTGVNVSQISTLIFQNGNINSKASNSLPPGLTTLELIGHPLTNISDDAFKASTSTLRKVYISEAKFYNLPLALKELTNLTELYISSTWVNDWNIATLRQISATLENLELRGVHLSSWHNLISFLHLLRKLDLSYNSLEEIPDNTFRLVKDSITTLQMSHTDLTHVPQALSMLSNLKTLDLSASKSLSVSEVQKITGLSFARKLEHLSLDSLLLPRIANFSNLTSLTSLFFYNNRISDIPTGSLPASLTSLDLGFNGLSSVPPDLANLPGLSYLELSGNSISWIEPNSFPSRLTDLALNSNNINTIANSTFKNLNFLRQLDLNLNPISRISSSAFSDLVSLQLLDLSGSNLTEIPIAFALLNPQTDISFTTRQPLSCPCPAPPELVQWFASLVHLTLGLVRCSNGLLVNSYLSGQCGQPTATP